AAFRSLLHAPPPPVQDHAPLNAALGRGGQVVFGRGVGELIHGHVDAVPGAVDEAVDGGEARARPDQQWSGPGHARGTGLHRTRGGGAARGGVGDLDLAPGHGEQYDREGRRGGEGTAAEHNGILLSGTANRCLVAPSTTLAGQSKPVTTRL